MDVAKLGQPVVTFDAIVVISQYYWYQMIAKGVTRNTSRFEASKALDCGVISKSRFLCKFMFFKSLLTTGTLTPFCSANLLFSWGRSRLDTDFS